MDNLTELEAEMISAVVDNLQFCIQTLTKVEELLCRLASIQSMTDTTLTNSDGVIYDIDEIDKEIGDALNRIEGTINFSQRMKDAFSEQLSTLRLKLHRVLH